MSATIIDGNAISAAMREEIAKDVTKFKEEKGVTPGLAVVLVGDDPASHVYVRKKEEACAEAGMNSFKHALPGSASEQELLDLLDQLNNDDAVHGILVQLPLPDQIDATKVLYAINPDKDVDGFHPVNVGRLSIGEPIFPPCTPAGIIEMLHRTGVETSGANAVVVGRSNIVGKPIAMLLLGENCTVTIAHSRTKDLADVTRAADILVAAVGVPKMITGDMVGEGAVVIDVGVSRTEDGLVGDVDFEAAKERASAITPVPGGVGPMTIAMLMKNTLAAARLSASA